MLELAVAIALVSRPEPPALCERCRRSGGGRHAAAVAGRKRDFGLEQYTREFATAAQLFPTSNNESVPPAETDAPSCCWGCGRHALIGNAHLRDAAASLGLGRLLELDEMDRQLVVVARSGEQTCPARLPRVPVVSGIKAAPCRAEGRGAARGRPRGHLPRLCRGGRSPGQLASTCAACLCHRATRKLGCCQLGPQCFRGTCLAWLLWLPTGAGARVEVADR